MSQKPPIAVVEAGIAPYAVSQVWQQKLHRERASGQSGDVLLLVEHPHVYTLGRRFSGEHLLFTEEELAERGIELHQTDRGGSITYHGPGQLVAYPIIKLADRPGGLPDVMQYLEALEEAVIQAVAEFGITAEKRRGSPTGVWVENKKLAAIGVKFGRGVTKHGVAVNVSTDLSYFEGMVPCGISAAGVTSMEKLLGRSVEVTAVGKVLADKLAGVLGRRPVKASLADVGLENVESRAGVSRPAWLKTRLRTGANYIELKGMVGELGLHTVCEEAKCPNIYECWEAREATFLILGDQCTRRCSFCDISTGKPGPLDFTEPYRVARAVEKMGLNYAVVTGVERDDVSPVDVAGVWAATVKAIRRRIPGCGVEVLTGDLKGDKEALAVVLRAKPSVFAHNIETVRRLHQAIRPGFRYDRSLAVLKAAKAVAPRIPTKSNLILGLGETHSEVIEALRDIRFAGVDLVTIGQYLAPSGGHTPVRRWVTPAEFEEYRLAGEELGFAWVESGPLVRSSYHAGRQYQAAARRLNNPALSVSGGAVRGP